MTFQKGNTYRRQSYINYDLQERECTECGLIKPFSEFSIAFKWYVRSMCKECRAKATAHEYRVKRLELSMKNKEITAIAMYIVFMMACVVYIALKTNIVPIGY